MLGMADIGQLLTQTSWLSTSGEAREELGGRKRTAPGGCSATSFQEGLLEGMALTGKTELESTLSEH